MFPARHTWPCLFNYYHVVANWYCVSVCGTISERAQVLGHRRHEASGQSVSQSVGVRCSSFPSISQHKVQLQLQDSSKPLLLPFASRRDIPRWGHGDNICHRFTRLAIAYCHQYNNGNGKVVSRETNERTNGEKEKNFTFSPICVCACFEWKVARKFMIIIHPSTHIDQVEWHSICLDSTTREWNGFCLVARNGFWLEHCETRRP